MKTEKLSNNIVLIDSQIIFPVNNFIDKIFSRRKVKKILQKYNIKQYSFNHFYKKGMIEINKLSLNTIMDVAKDVCKEFKDDKIVVKEFNTKRILFMDTIEK
jgi:hypothetical protein